MKGYPFNYHARKALAIARTEAVRLGDPVIEPRHIVLGIIREGDSAAVDLLRGAFASLDELSRRLERARQHTNEGYTRDDRPLPYARASQRVLKRAMYEARRLGHEAVGASHLLLGVLPHRPRRFGDWWRHLKFASGSDAAALTLEAGGLRLEATRVALSRVAEQTAMDSW